jgi:hypothetical protein
MKTETAFSNCRSVTDTGDGETQNDQNNDGETDIFGFTGARLSELTACYKH